MDHFFANSVHIKLASSQAAQQSLFSGKLVSMRDMFKEAPLIERKKAPVESNSDCWDMPPLPLNESFKFNYEVPQ